MESEEEEAQEQHIEEGSLSDQIGLEYRIG